MKLHRLQSVIIKKSEAQPSMQGAWQVVKSECAMAHAKGFLYIFVAYVDGQYRRIPAQEVADCKGTVYFIEAFCEI